MIYITGDRHSDFTSDVSRSWDIDDELIVLGDLGCNYYLDGRDDISKTSLNSLGITIFAIHGNHEERPYNIATYKTKEYRGGVVYYEEKYPNILFARDGETYDFDGKKAIVIGGAYSIDKRFRKMMGYNWFESEQPDNKIKQDVLNTLNNINWDIDIVLTHTCPYSYEPKEWFMKGVIQALVDKSTEKWLDEIEKRLTYKKWYCGHFHGEKRIDKLEFLYKTVKPLEI